MNAISNRHLIIALVLLTLALTLPVLNSFPIALDEPFSLFFAQQDLSDLKGLFINENNPPLYFVLLHFWIKIFGLSAWSVRILSLLFALLTIPILFKLASKIVDKWGAVAVVLLFIFSNFSHYHAMEARTYALFVFLFATILYGLYNIIFEQNIRAIIYLTISNVALLYAHYLGGFVIAVELAILVYFYRELNKAIWLKLLLGIGIMILAYLPGLLLLWIRLNDVSDKGTWVPKPELSELYGNIIRFYNGKYAVVILFGLMLIAALFAYVKTRKIPVKGFVKKEFQFVFLSFLVPYIGMFIVSIIFEPIFLDRYLLFTIIPLFVSLVVVIKVFIQNTIKPIYTLFVVLPMILFFDIIPDSNREPDNIANWVNINTNENKSIVICPPFFDLAFFYHFDRAVFMDPKNFEANKLKNAVHTVYSSADFEEITLNNQVVYVDMDAKFLFTENGIKSFLNQSYRLIDSALFKGNAEVYYYSK